MLTCLRSCSLLFCPARGSPSLPGVGMGGTAGWGVTTLLSQDKHNEGNCTTAYMMSLDCFYISSFEPQITPGPLAQPLVGFLWK